MHETISKHPVIATLYSPENSPQALPAGLFPTLELVSAHDNPIDKVAMVLGCPSEAVEIVGRAASFIAFAVLHHHGTINRPAMQALAHLATHDHRGFGYAQTVTGPVLVLQQAAPDKRRR